LAYARLDHQVGPSESCVTVIMAQTITPIQLQSASTLLIAIDFGTTFTGVAFAYSRGETIQDPKRAVDTITVIKEWPNYNRSHAQKTPTVLSYHSSPPTWGASVKPHHEPKISHFKLGLEANASSHYGYRTSSNPFMMQLKHPRFRFKTAVDFTAEYLDCVFKWVHETYFPDKFGTDFLESQQLSYVITVPAIWRDAAKDLTRVAAKKAGVPSDRMVLITEPEAAALYCATLCNEVDLRVGNHFVVCDAGGGTVVHCCNSALMS
jgi:molecular chaperone DnaK (HSP70)